MRYRALAVMLLGGAMAVAQQTAPQTPPAGEKVPTTGGEAQSQTPSRPAMAHPHQHHGGMQTGNKAEMHAEMSAHIEKMRSTVEQMRANAAKVKDANVRAALQLDADMWSQMVGHMEKMHARMQSGQGGMMGHGEGKGSCCAGMMKKHGEQGTAATGKEDMAAGMGGSGGMSCGKGGGGCCGGESGGGCCGGEGGGCCGGHKSQQPGQ